MRNELKWILQISWWQQSSSGSVSRSDCSRTKEGKQAAAGVRLVYDEERTEFRDAMTHFRGQIRGPHWGPAMDNKLIDFWRKHECLFNSSVCSYNDKNLKRKLWTEFALAVGKPGEPAGWLLVDDASSSGCFKSSSLHVSRLLFAVSDVERRSRSLRTQYGRVLYHPERVSAAQQKMLRDRLDFLKPYIVRRTGDSSLEDKFMDHDEEDEEELETEGSVDQDMGSSLGSPLDVDVGGQDLDEPQSVCPTPSFAPRLCPRPQPQVTDVMSLRRPRDRGEDPQPDQTPKHDILNQFAEVMLADMRQIRDAVLLMRLRRDVSDLVFKAVEEDVRRRCIRAPPSVTVNGAQSCSSPLQLHPNISWRQRFLKRRNKGCETASRTQRWEAMRRESRSPPPVHPQQAAVGMRANGSRVTAQVFQIKGEAETHVVKLEEGPLPLDSV